MARQTDKSVVQNRPYVAIVPSQWPRCRCAHCYGDYWLEAQETALRLLTEPGGFHNRDGRKTQNEPCGEGSLNRCDLAGGVDDVLRTRNAGTFESLRPRVLPV